MKRFIAIFFLSIVYLASAGSAAQDSACLNFISPVQGQTCTGSVCTLSVNVCPAASSIDVQARYIPSGSDTPAIITIGTLTRPPYKLIWNIADIPNQVLTGVNLLAEATLSDGQVQAARQEGVFFLNHKIDTHSHKVYYAYPGTSIFTDDTIHLGQESTHQFANSSMYWNEKGLTILTQVRDPFFYSGLPPSVLNAMGVEICIDPKLSRKPYPHSGVLIYAVPLASHPYAINYTPQFGSDGSFKLVSTSTVCSFDCTIRKNDFKGYSVSFTIPLEVLGNSIQDKMSGNIIVKFNDNKGGVTRISWEKGIGAYDVYSPSLWGELLVEPKPLLQNRQAIWAVFFALGILISCLIPALNMLGRRPAVIYKFEESEREQLSLERIRGLSEQQITKKDLSLESAAQELQIPKRKINSLIKHSTGLSYRNYVMFSRIEIAKERLRSSHSSEASIAEHCGFADVNEMERYFMKFHKTTPYKFRMEQQVA